MARKSAVVVGVDGSSDSRRALELAARLAEVVRAELVPVYAVPDLWLAGGLNGMPAVQPAVYDLLVHDAREQIERFVRDTVGNPPALEVRTGVAAIAIEEVARERRAEVVVLGGKHHVALARGLGRSTAHYLVRTLDIPLLVVGASALPVQHVLAAVDLSSASLPVLRAAEQFAKLFGAQVKALHVVEPLQLFYLPVTPIDQEGYAERSRATFEELMKGFAHIAPADRLVRTGAVAEVLAEEAAAWPAHLVIVGSHGKGWVDRLLVGSTTERVLNVLPSSILVIPTAGRSKGKGARRRASPRRRPPARAKRRRH